MSEQYRTGQSEWSTYTRTWWKFVLAGPIVVAAVVVGAALGIDAWFVGFSAVIVAGLLLAVGGLLGLAHLVVRRRSVART